MTNVFTTKKITVPGLLGQDALQEQLKQFGESQKSTQQAAPPPDAAVELADRVATEYLSVPSARIAAAPLSRARGTITGAPLNQEAAGTALRDTILGGPIMPVMRLAERFGTLTPEEGQAEAEARQADAQETEDAMRSKAAIREQLRGMPDEEAAKMGLPIAPGGTTEQEREALRLRDEQAVKPATERRELADKVVAGEAPAPTQTWWLNAAQTGARTAAQMVTAGLKYGPLWWEQYEAVITGSSEKSWARAQIEAVDKELTKMLPGDPARAKDFVTELSAGVGSMTGFMIAGYAGAAMGIPAAAGAGLLGAAVGGTQQYEDAELFDANGVQKFLSLIAGSGLGAAEAIPIDRMFMRVDTMNGGIVRRLLQNTTASSVEEFIQETSQAVGEDIVAKYLAGYDEDRQLKPRDWLRQGAIGALVGGATGAGVTALGEAGMSQDQLMPESQREQIVGDVFNELQREFDNTLGTQLMTERVEGEFDIADPATGVDETVLPAITVGADGETTIDLPETVELQMGDTTVPVEVAPAVETPQFQEWFGDSKVRDEAGAPRVMYHGTAKSGFSYFDTYASNYGLMGMGGYFTADPEIASTYADKGVARMERRGEEPTPGVYPVYLSVKNPVDMEAPADVNAWSEAFSDYDIELTEGMTNEQAYRAAEEALSYEELPSYEGAEIMQGNLRAMGFDGITHLGGGRVNADGPRHRVFVAFDPEQIKSVNNRGTFDPNDPDIMARVEPEAPRVEMEQRRGGTVPVDERGTVELNHWAPQMRDVLDPAQRGTGPLRAEEQAEFEAATGTAAGRAPMRGEPTRPAAGVPVDPAQPEAAAADPESDVGLSKISANFIKLMGLTARQGRFTLKGKNILGQYSSRSTVVRLRTWNDLSTLVHEGGHALHDSMSGSLDAFAKANETLLMKVADDHYGASLGGAPKRTHIREGFAEFFRLYVLNRRYAQKKYPQLSADFEAILQREAPDLARGFDVVGQQFAAWLQLPSATLMRNMIVPAKQETGINAAIAELREVGFGTWMQEYARGTMEAAVNRNAALNTLVSQMLNTGQTNQGKAIDLTRADDPRVLIRLARNAGARAMVQVTDGVMGYKSVASSTRGLRDALLISQGLDPSQNPRAIDETRQQDFDTYLVALRSLDEYRRLAEGKIERPPVGASEGDIRQTITDLEAQYGDSFTKAAEIVNEYGMALWQKQYDAGLMSKETWKDGLDRQFYAPLQRDMSDKQAALGESAVTGGRSIVKRFRGSDRDIVSPFAVLMQKTFALEQTIAQNDVMKALALLSDRAGTAGAFVERVPATTLMGKQFTVKEVARQLTNDDTLTEADAADLMTILGASIEEGNVISMFRSEQASAKGENILFYWENGKVAALQLKDGDIGADVVNLINAVGRENMNFGTELIAMTSTAFRTAITSWPDFLAVNFIRDQMSAWVLTDVGFKPFATGLRGVGDELRQNQWAKMYNASMGIMGGMNVAALHESKVNRSIEGLRSKGYLARAFNDKGFAGAIRGMARVVELTETGTRLGIFRGAYERAKKDGLSDWEAAIEASYTATDYIDFGLNGSRMLHARRLIPFINAQLQGLYKMLRTLGGDEVRQRKGLKFALGAFFKNSRNMDLSRAEQQALVTGKKAWAKMAVLGVLSAALHFLFEDDPDYQEAGEYLRTTGWVIPMGDGRIFYVPKPFELALVANAVERGLEAASGDTAARDRFLRSLALSFMPPTSPPAVQTLVEYVANKDFFTGREIVPSYMQALDPQLQFDNYTSDIAKGISGITGWSPMVVDHFLSGLGASAYRDITTMTQMLNPDRPSIDQTDAPILRRFVRDARRGSASAQDFWAQASTMTGKMRTAEMSYRRFLDAGNEMAANKFLSELESEDEKAYALLNAHFETDAKRLNPFYRGRQVTTIVSAMRREINSELGLEDTAPWSEGAIKLTAREKAEVDEVLSEFARREIRNTLIATNTSGWEGKRRLDTQPTRDLLDSVEPRVAEELTRRMKKARVYDADTVFEYWPEVRDRLISDREDAFLADLVSIAEVTQ